MEDTSRPFAKDRSSPFFIKHSLFPFIRQGPSMPEKSKIVSSAWTAWTALHVICVVCPLRRSFYAQSRMNTANPPIIRANRAASKIEILAIMNFTGPVRRLLSPQHFLEWTTETSRWEIP